MVRSGYHKGTSEDTAFFKRRNEQGKAGIKAGNTKNKPLSALSNMTSDQRADYLKHKGGDVKKKALTSKMK